MATPAAVWPSGHLGSDSPSDHTGLIETRPGGSLAPGVGVLQFPQPAGLGPVAEPVRHEGRDPGGEEECRELHRRDGAFIIPNPWDAGTAKLLAHLGFEALATTSARYAFSIGRRDNQVGRDLMMEHVRDVVSATGLPVSADLENGFGDDPETVSETIRLGADAGLAGSGTAGPERPGSQTWNQ